MQNDLTLLRAIVAGFALVLVLSCASTGLGQSGRRVRKSDPAPVPVSTPEPTPSPTPIAQKPKPRFTFLVGLDRRDVFASLPLYSYEEVLRGLVDRLADSPAVQVLVQSEMSRSDAIRKAKAEREGGHSATRVASSPPELRASMAIVI